MTVFKWASVHMTKYISFEIGTDTKVNKTLREGAMLHVYKRMYLLLFGNLAIYNQSNLNLV